MLKNYSQSTKGLLFDYFLIYELLVSNNYCFCNPLQHLEDSFLFVADGTATGLINRITVEQWGEIELGKN